MAKKLLDNKFLYVVLSVILAFCLWYYVTTVEGDSRTNTISNIPVTFIGQDVLMENGLMITSEPPTVDIEFRASATTWQRLTRDAVKVTVDVSAITTPGEQTLGYQVSYSGVPEYNVTQLNRTPVNVSFTVEEYVTREVEIRGELTGHLPDEYTFRLENGQPKFEFSPQTLTVSGRKSDVDQIAYALVTVNNEQITETIRGEYPYQLIGLDGAPLDREALDVECANETVSTVLQVQRLVEIPLNVSFTPGGGATEENVVSCDIEPKSITVAGEDADLESLKELNINIDLAAITEDETTLVRPIPLAEELSNPDGVTEATIKITLVGLSTKVVEVTQFTAQNVPEGYNASIRTKSLSVTVRGPEEELEQISAENLRVVADLSGINLASGTYTVDAKIHFDWTGSAGVVSTDYPLVVRMTRR